MSFAAIAFALLASVGPYIEVAEESAGWFGVGHGRPDALLASSRGSALVWTQSFAPDGNGGGGNVCHVSGLIEKEPIPGDSRPRPWDQEFLREVATETLCCVDRTVVEPLSRAGFLAVTTCSMSQGFWLWSQTLAPDGRPSDLPAPIFPVPGRAQHTPRLVSAGRDTFWLVWIEGDRDPDVGGTVRAARIDSSGELVAGPFDLSGEGDGFAQASTHGESLSIAPLDDGGLIVAWIEFSGRQPRGIRLRIVDRAGRPITPEIPATPEGHERVQSPRIIAGRKGPLTLVWQTRFSDPDAPPRLFFRFFSRSGETLSGAQPVAVDEPTRSQGLPRIVSDGSHSIVVWQERPTTGRDVADGWIALRRWSPERGPIGVTTRFPATLSWSRPFLEAIPEGSGAFNVYWHPNGPNGFTDPGRLAWRRVVVPDAR